MIIFFYLPGGTVMTQTTLTPDMTFCQEHKGQMVDDYKSNRIHLGGTDTIPDKIIPICVKIP